MPPKESGGQKTRSLSWGDAVILNLERRRQTHVLESKFCTDLS